MQRRFAAVLVVVLFTGLASRAYPLSPPPPLKAEVLKVIDGNTIEVKILSVSPGLSITLIAEDGVIKALVEGNVVTVRYIGVNAPEQGQPGYSEATEINRLLVGGRTVWLALDRTALDKHGRLLAYVYLDEKGYFMVNQALVTSPLFQPVITVTPALKIGVVDAEALFTRVFLPQVAAERSTMQAKAQAIQDLQAKYAQGKIKADVYQQQYAKLQAEYLQAQVQVNTSMLDKMIASPGFANLRADLQNFKDHVTPLVEQVNALVEQAQMSIRDYTTFFNQLRELQTVFQQVDQLLTQVAATKILEISHEVARERGYDLVLRTKDVVMYWRAPAISDLTPEVEKRLWNLFLSQ